MTTKSWQHFKDKLYAKALFNKFFIYTVIFFSGTHLFRISGSLRFNIIFCWLGGHVQSKRTFFTESSNTFYNYWRGHACHAFFCIPITKT